MKKYLLFSFLLTFFFCLHSQLSISQTISYEYDASGNRISRTISLDASQQKSTEDAKREFKDKLDEKDILIYPNPVENELTVKIPELGENFATLEIYAEDGRLLFADKKATSENVLNLGNYPYGLYFLTIKIGESTTKWKIMKK